MEDFKTIIKDHHPLLYKIGKVYSSAEDFDDLYQEMLISIWKGLKNFKGEAKLSTWLYRVVLNTALTYHRNNKRQNLPTDELEKAEQIRYVPETPEADQREQVTRLYAAIRKLKKEERSVILLYLEEKNYEEIAEIIGISKSNVGVKINRIKKKLYNHLSMQPHG